MIVRRKRALRTDTVELSKEALDLLKRESVAFAHLPSAAAAQGTEKGSELTSTLPKATAAAVIRRYVKGN